MTQALGEFIHKYIFVCLFLIVLLAGILRGYNVQAVPVSLYWDEVASTYNAYSIALTGKDEFGTPFPLLFRSFNDYKTPGNIYLTAISTLIFGLNEFAARASSVILGTATVLVTFFLIRDLFAHFRKSLKWSIRPEILGLLTAFLTAISPWHIQFSRTGFEANVGVFFIVLGTYLFILSFRKSLFFLFSLVSFAVSVYMYRSIHIFLPLFFLSSSIVFFQEIKRLPRKFLFGGVALFIVIVLPFLPWIISEGGLARARQVSVVSNSSEAVYDAASKALEAGNTLESKVFFNRRVVYIGQSLKYYFQNYSPYFLFISGDSNLRHSPIGMGVMYLWELPFVLIGLFVIITRLPRRLGIFILLWILIAPIPASLSVPSPHALRSLNMIPMPQLLVAMGMYWIYQIMQKKWRIVYILAISVVLVAFFIRYMYLYYDVTAKKASTDWADGYKQLVENISIREGSYDKVVISGHYWQPYIYFLFYNKYDPKLFQLSGSSAGFDKYVFGGTSWDKEQRSQELHDVNLREYAGAQHILAALSPSEYESQKGNVIRLDTIYNHNGEVVFIICELP